MAQRRRSREVQPPYGPERAFGEALRAVRKQQNVSQEALALEAGFDRTYISLVERGIQSPTVRNVVKMAAVLGVRASEIVARMEAALEQPRKPSLRPKGAR